HSFVGLAAVLVAFGTYLDHSSKGSIDTVMLVELTVGSFIGAITFTGSLIAFGKLQAILSSSPLVFRGQHLLNLVLALVMVGASVDFVAHQHMVSFLISTGL